MNPSRKLRIYLVAFILPLVAILITASNVSGNRGRKIDYRLTLEVEVDGIKYTGSGVIESDWHDQSAIKGLGIPWVVHIRGEAVAVDLGKHGLLFALLTAPAELDRGSSVKFYPPDPQQVFLRQFSKLGQGSLTSEDVYALSRRRDSVTLPFSMLPMLVTFRDVHSPKTIEQVDPDNLEAAFGPSVKLLHASIAITDEAPTTGIDNRLTWLTSLNGGYLNGSSISGPGPLGDVNTAYFKIGEP